MLSLSIYTPSHLKITLFKRVVFGKYHILSIHMTLSSAPLKYYFNFIISHFSSYVPSASRNHDSCSPSLPFILLPPLHRRLFLPSSLVDVPSQTCLIPLIVYHKYLQPYNNTNLRTTTFTNHNLSYSSPHPWLFWLSHTTYLFGLLNLPMSPRWVFPTNLTARCPVFSASSTRFYLLSDYNFVRLIILVGSSS